MDFGLRDRICLVTGASSGIGRATAVMLAGEGARLVIAARSREPLETISAEIVRGGGSEPVCLEADLAVPGAADALAAAALDACGQVDVLVNNAGGSRPMTDPTDADAWTEAFQLNFASARRLAECLAPSMIERRWGRVINISGAIIARKFNAAGPAKAALESWSRGAAGTYAVHGITVNCVAPGRLNTRQILERLHPTEAARQAFIDANIPAGRFGEPEEAAALITFLASARASYVTGTTIPVDGGTMRLAF